MNKYLKFFLGAVVLCAISVSAVSCEDDDDYRVPTTHNGGCGK